MASVKREHIGYILSTQQRLYIVLNSRTVMEDKTYRSPGMSRIRPGPLAAVFIDIYQLLVSIHYIDYRQIVAADSQRERGMQRNREGWIKREREMEREGKEKEREMCGEGEKVKSYGKG